MLQWQETQLQGTLVGVLNSVFFPQGQLDASVAAVEAFNQVMAAHDYHVIHRSDGGVVLRPKKS